MTGVGQFWSEYDVSGSMVTSDTDMQSVLSVDSAVKVKHILCRGNHYISDLATFHLLKFYFVF